MGLIENFTLFSIQMVDELREKKTTFFNKFIYL